MRRAVRIPGARGDLAGRLDHGGDKSRGVVLFAHCFTCSKDHKAISWIARRLHHQHGLSCLRFDFSGLGDSAGLFSETTFESNREDLLAAATWLGREVGAPRILFGHSLGAAACLSVASQIPSLGLVTTLAAPSDTVHLAKWLLSAAPQLGTASATAELTLLGRSQTIGAFFVEDLHHHDLLGSVAELETPLLVVHSRSDEVIGIGHAKSLVAAHRGPATMVELDSADHLLMKERAEADFVADLVAASAERWGAIPAR